VETNVINSGSGSDLTCQSTPFEICLVSAQSLRALVPDEEADNRCLDHWASRKLTGNV
jgi:hypothetical protein